MKSLNLRPAMGWPLDLPSPWQKPPFEVLLTCLEHLRVETPAWELDVPLAPVPKQERLTTQEAQEITSYLSFVIKSSLSWLRDEDQREKIWNEASKRISERCGRAGTHIMNPWSG